jgi:hypothetical protein
MVAVMETFKSLIARAYPALIWGALFGLVVNSSLRAELSKPARESLNAENEIVQSARGDASLRGDASGVRVSTMSPSITKLM